MCGRVKGGEGNPDDVFVGRQGMGGMEDGKNWYQFINRIRADGVDEVDDKLEDEYYEE